MKELKEMFLKQYTPRTQQYMRYILYSDQAKIMETRKGKDIYEFNRDEVLQLIGESSPTSIHSGISQLSVIKKYIDFAIVNGHLTTGINFADLIKPNDVNEVINLKAIELKYITRDDLKIVADSLNNAIDATFIVLLFEGVRGKKLHEIINLRKEDVDFEKNTLKLTDADGSIRHRRVSQYLIDLIKEAINQKEYLVNISSDGTRSPYTRRIPSTGYVIRGSRIKQPNPIRYRTLLGKKGDRMR